MLAREAAIETEGGELAALLPLLQRGTSDSANLDNAVELLIRTGRPLPQAFSMLMPPAWEKDPEIPPDVRAFFAYHAARLEPWDGPALVVFTDGKTVGAAMDRNGLRPARTVETTDGLFLLASEAGVADVAEESIAARGRLGPADILALDLENGERLATAGIRRRLAAAAPWAQWMRARHGLPDHREPVRSFEAPTPERLRVWKAFGVTREQVRGIVRPMALEGREPVGSMGDDTPLAILSELDRPLPSYFKQRFAQVTNPAIDPIRESLVMSLDVLLGPARSFLSEDGAEPPLLSLGSPILRDSELLALQRQPAGGTYRVLDTTFSTSPASGGFRKSLDRLAHAAERAAASGASVLLLSDRPVSPSRAAIPVLLAAAAVHRRLVSAGLRLRVGLIVETGAVRDEHDVASLLAFGADAVNPYLALEIARSLAFEERATLPDPREAEARLVSTLDRGLQKILAKMGIATLRSYSGGPFFEAVGIAEEVVSDFFPGAGCPIGGAGLDDIAATALRIHAAAFDEAASQELAQGGDFGYRRGGEAHAFTPEIVRSLHAVARGGEAIDYEIYSGRIAARDPISIRDLLDFGLPRDAPLPLSDVEPVESIRHRFMTAAMSIGALGPEAHETLAIAMNRIGARSNSGEGGADPARFWSLLPNGDSANDRIKQVASARFGVTAEYLVSAQELQIKMAQGSKPGEGGQLPGEKVTTTIARLRRCRPGATLISPPPHHDIYSIEDLAELIYVLKRVHPGARVGVKLVATAGIGTIATGVAKAHADSILISGHDGGTGASPLGSIKNAGIPWELGLAEAQQALVESGLRRRVRLQVDGGLKTGRDVVVAALLGAEEFAFGSAALVAIGCVMARQCHANTCPVGIATQRPELRERFRGTPQSIIHLLTAVAGEVREILAGLGLKRLEEAVGRTELLALRPRESGGRAPSIDLSRVVPGPRPVAGPRRCMDERNDPPRTGHDLDEKALAFLSSETPRPLLEFPITNADRAVGARIAGALASAPGRSRARTSGAKLRFHGSAGQSFGAFCVDGMAMSLEGEANDHLAKGMSGGSIAVFPRACAAFPGSSTVITGNAALYGATGGTLYVAGSAGERFAIRNSGASAVVEGVGDHACEYMTAGRVVILGKWGRNLGAGMAGGTVYLFDPERRAARTVNGDMVEVAALSSRDSEELRALVEAHRSATGSGRAAALLENWGGQAGDFQKIVPRAGKPQAFPQPAGNRVRAGRPIETAIRATRPPPPA